MASTDSVSNRIPNTTKNADHIVVREQSFNTRVAYDLVLALDQELATMYPDWDDLPHPNLGKGNNPAPEEGTLLSEDTPRPIINMDESTVNDNDPAAAQNMLEKTSHNGTAKYSDLKFFVAFDNESGSEKGVGCIALNPLPYFPEHHAPAPGTAPSHTKEPPTVELKRMYVSPSHRRAGVSSKLLRHAMEYAREQMKMDRVVLETGLRQEPSVRLYYRHGFTKRENFGDWVGAGPEDGGISICLEKWLV